MSNIRVRRLRNDVLAVFLGIGEIYLMINYQTGGMLLLEKDPARVHAAMERRDENGMAYPCQSVAISQRSHVSGMSPLYKQEMMGLFQDGPRAEKAHQLLHPLMLGIDLMDDVHFMDRTSAVALQ